MPHPISIVLFAVLGLLPAPQALGAQIPGAGRMDVESPSGDPAEVDGAVIRAPARGDVRTRGEGVYVQPNAHTDASIRSREGFVWVGNGADAADVSTRSGTIFVGTGASSGEVSTRSGSVILEAQSHVRGSVETRDGPLEMKEGARVVGPVTTRMGALTFEGSVVDGVVRTRHGPVRMTGARITRDLDSEGADVELRDGSVVEGDLIVLMPPQCGLSGWFSGCLSGLFGDSRAPVVRVDATSTVEGRLIVDERARLEISTGASVPEVEWYPDRHAWD